MRKRIMIFAMTAVLCFSGLRSKEVFATSTEQTQSSSEYIYEGAESENEEDSASAYIYQENQSEEPVQERIAETKPEQEPVEEETLQDIGVNLLNNNKINITILMILFAALGVVLYKNDKLVVSRKK